MDSKKLLKILGERIRAVRKAQKISQERLAELSGLHPTYISNIEQGKVNASIYSFYMVAHALGIPFSELVGFPSGKTNKIIENELAALLSQIRSLDRKKQAIFIPAAKGLLTGVAKA